MIATCMDGCEVSSYATVSTFRKAVISDAREGNWFEGAKCMRQVFRLWIMVVWVVIGGFRSFQIVRLHRITHWLLISININLAHPMCTFDILSRNPEVKGLYKNIYVCMLLSTHCHKQLWTITLPGNKLSHFRLFSIQHIGSKTMTLLCCIGAWAPAIGMTRFQSTNAWFLQAYIWFVAASKFHRQIFTYHTEWCDNGLWNFWLI